MFDGAAFFLACGMFWGEAHQSLQTAIDQANRTDPFWRYEDIQAQRPKLADKDNGALQVRAALKALPKDWLPFVTTLKFPNERKISKDLRFRLADQFEEQLWDLPPPAALNDQQSAAIASEVKQIDRCLAIARSLRRFKHGRPVRQGGPDTPDLEVLQGARQLAEILKLEALDHVHRRRPGAALQSCQTIMHAGRLVGEEPEPIALLVRMSLVPVACGMMERVLANGEASDAILLLMQTRLEEEEPAMSPLQGARWQRAANQRLFEQVRAGKKSVPDLVASLHNPKLEMPTEADFFVAAYTNGLERTWAAVLRQDNVAVETLKTAEEKLPGAVRKVGELPKIHWLGAEFNSWMPRLASSAIRVRMTLRTARTALAVERYRLAKGKWPVRLEDLVPAYLARVPLDYYAGKAPLKLAKFGGGVVVYSVGPDGKDNGGKLDYQPGEAIPLVFFEGLDIGFRLWDRNARRQPPGPPVLIPEAKKPDQ
jgi:hypothetical protein